MSDLPPLPALRAFEAAARLGSLSRAAAELHVTHGAISRHVRSLEEALGVPLFARQGRGLVPTEAGQVLREASSEAFARLRQTWRQLRRRPGNAPAGPWLQRQPAGALGDPAVGTPGRGPASP